MADSKLTYFELSGKRRPPPDKGMHEAKDHNDPNTSELNFTKKQLDMPMMTREFQLMKSERDVMELLSSTWATNKGLSSIKKTFAMNTEAAASKASSLDG